MAFAPVHALPIPDLHAWQVDVAQLLEEHHLVAWSHGQRERLIFSTGLADYLRTLHDVEVWSLHGQEITDLESFCAQLEAMIPGRPLRRSIDEVAGVVDFLRMRRPDIAGLSSTKVRYYIWQDANVLLRHDHVLFGRLVDAIAGVAAESEYVSEDLLLIHRGVFVGAPSIDAYAEDPQGQFRCWASERREPALWEIISGLPHPPVLRYHIGAIAG
jgi:hypothetical protein